MEEILLAIIAVMLIILTAELTVVFYYAIIFLREAATVAKRVKMMEGNLETKLEKLEEEVALLGAKLAKAIFRGINKLLK